LVAVDEEVLKDQIKVAINWRDDANAITLGNFYGRPGMLPL